MTPAAYIPAKWQPHSPRRAPIRVVLVHTTQPGTPAPPEVILRRNIARSTAHYFQGVDRPASAHVVVDPWEVIECVKPENEAVGAPGVNADGYHIELCGFAEWDAAEWGDTLADQMLRLAGAWAAGICTAHGLPALFLNAEMLKAGARGLSGHKQASDAYHPGGHWDPGPGFPWPKFLEYVRSNMDTPTPPPAPDRLTIDGVPAAARMIVQDGEHYVNLRDLCAVRGWEVSWDEGSRTAAVRTTP